MEPSICTSCERDSSDTHTTSLQGISVAGFQEFIDLHGGREACEGKTTSAVKPLVLASTARMTAAATTILSPTHVARATVFLSHVYSGGFLDVVDAVASWEAGQVDTPAGGHFFYFDLLVVNQHGQDAVVPFEVLRDTFAGGVRGAGRTLLVLDDNAAAATRLWCVFEIVTTLEGGVPLEVIMAPRHGDAFRAQLVDDYASVTRRTMGVDVARAHAREEADERNIRRLITDGQGFLQASQRVIGAMQTWMLAQSMAGPQERDLSALCINTVKLLIDLGRLGDAEVLANDALAVRTASQGPEHPDTIKAANVLAHVLLALGRLVESEAMCRPLLALARRVLGDDHIDSLDAASLLARLAQLQGRGSEAEPFLLEVLAARRRVLGPLHADTLAIAMELAELLRSEGKLSQAEPLYSDVLAKRRATLGNDHPDTISSALGLALLLHELGHLDEAEPLLQEALHTQRRIHGDSHPAALAIVRQVALLLDEQGRESEAEALHEEALTGLRIALGEDHPETLVAASHVAELRCKRGKHATAVPLLRTVLEARRRVLGSGHASTLTSMRRLGRCLVAVGELAKAECLVREALGGMIALHGDLHPNSDACREHLASILRALGGHDAEADALAPLRLPIAADDLAMTAADDLAIADCQWPCAMCSLLNDQGSAQCALCGATSPPDVATPHTGRNMGSEGGLSRTCGEMRPEWSCGVCTLVNDGVEQACAVCSSPRPSQLHHCQPR